MNLEELPFKRISHEELYKMMGEASWKPIYLYRHLIKTDELEEGSDGKFRYILHGISRNNCFSENK